MVDSNDSEIGTELARTLSWQRLSDRTPLLFRRLYSRWYFWITVPLTAVIIVWRRAVTRKMDAARTLVQALTRGGQCLRSLPAPLRAHRLSFRSK